MPKLTRIERRCTDCGTEGEVGNRVGRAHLCRRCQELYSEYQIEKRILVYYTYGEKRA